VSPNARGSRSPRRNEGRELLDDILKEALNGRARIPGLRFSEKSWFSESDKPTAKVSKKHFVEQVESGREGTYSPLTGGKETVETLAKLETRPQRRHKDRCRAASVESNGNARESSPARPCSRSPSRQAAECDEAYSPLTGGRETRDLRPQRRHFERFSEESTMSGLQEVYLEARNSDGSTRKGAQTRQSWPLSRGVQRGTKNFSGAPLEKGLQSMESGTDLDKNEFGVQRKGRAAFFACSPKSAQSPMDESPPTPPNLHGVTRWMSSESARNESASPFYPRQSYCQGFSAWPTQFGNSPKQSEFVSRLTESPGVQPRKATCRDEEHSVLSASKEACGSRREGPRADPQSSPGGDELTSSSRFLDKLQQASPSNAGPVQAPRCRVPEEALLQHLQQASELPDQSSRRLSYGTDQSSRPTVPSTQERSRHESRGRQSPPVGGGDGAVSPLWPQPRQRSVSPDKVPSPRECSEALFGK
jgi:hypothetical protein